MYCYKRWKREGGKPKLIEENYIEKNVPPKIAPKKPIEAEVVEQKKLSTYEMTLMLWNSVNILTGVESN